MTSFLNNPIQRPLPHLPPPTPPPPSHFSHCTMAVAWGAVQQACSAEKIIFILTLLRLGILDRGGY